MKSSAGIIIYVVVAIISGLIKKMAEDKTRQKQAWTDSNQTDPYTISLEDMLAEDSEPVETPTTFEIEEEPRSQQVAVSPVRQRRIPPRLNVAQAIVMSEIIRAPRAKRPWPSR